MKKNITLLFLLISIVNCAQDIEFTFGNPVNTNDGIDDFYEVDVYASSSTGFKIGDLQIRFFYNTEAFGEAVKDNEVLESLTPNGSLFGTTLFNGSVPQFSLLNIANTPDSFTIVYEANVSDGTFTENTITAVPTHLFTIKLKYEDVTKANELTFSTELLDTEVFTACGPYETTPFENAGCIDFPGTQLSREAISLDSTGAIINEGALGVVTFDNLEKAMTVFPNPMAESFLIKGDTSSIDGAKIYNINGVVLKNISVETLNQEIFLQDLSTGIYFLQLVSAKQRTIVKLVKI